MVRNYNYLKKDLGSIKPERAPSINFTHILRIYRRQPPPP